MKELILSYNLLTSIIREVDKNPPRHHNSPLSEIEAMCRVKKCCCCFGLKTGSMIIGILDLVFYLYLVVADSIELSHDGEAQIFIISFIGLVLSVIGAALLIFGVQKVSYINFLVKELILLQFYIGTPRTPFMLDFHQRSIPYYAIYCQHMVYLSFRRINRHSTTCGCDCHSSDFMLFRCICDCYR